MTRHAAGPRWYWSVYGINIRGPIPPDVTLQGGANDLEGAKTAFKKNWEKLLAAQRVKL
jgi:hypothetical protein